MWGLFGIGDDSRGCGNGFFTKRTKEGKGGGLGELDSMELRVSGIQTYAAVTYAYKGITSLTL